MMETLERAGWPGTNSMYSKDTRKYTEGPGLKGVVFSVIPAQE